MRRIRLILFVLVLLTTGESALYSQESVLAAAGDIKDSGGSVAYSVGQVFFNTYAGANGSEAQGVQQAYEISEVSGMEAAFKIKLELSAYPNPAHDFIFLKLEDALLPGLSYQLYDTRGKLLQNKKILSDETRIEMETLPAAGYYLVVLQENTKLTSFKIIKH